MPLRSLEPTSGVNINQVSKEIDVMPIVYFPEIVYQPFPNNPNFQDLTNHPPFGRLTVLGYAGKRGHYAHTAWFCLCECGVIIIVTAAHLKRGHSRSCGCKKLEELLQRVVKHGQARVKNRTKAYNTWAKVVRRCTVPSALDYSRYGGRGIKVAPEWQGENGFTNFYSCVGDPPTPQHSIERVDNSGDYEPGNVCWATDAEQRRNKRTNHFITFQGQTLCITDWARKIGIKYDTLKNRLNLYGWTIERALTTPTLTRKEVAPRKRQ